MAFLIRTLAALLVAIALCPARGAAPVKIVAAENVYGGIAQAIGGPGVEVVSVLANPDQDPHLFETAPSLARQIAQAQVLIVNGAGYDPWMDRLMAIAPRADRLVVNVAALAGKKEGDNPHLWYDPTAMQKVAAAIADSLSKLDPRQADVYSGRLKETLAGLARIQTRVAALRQKWQGTPVTATEPVFGPMADALGLAMRNQQFQLAVMNDTEPSARDIAAFEDDLRQRRVKALIYNKQVSGKLSERMIAIAKASRVPVVAVTETQPADISFTDWMLSQLDALDRALANSHT